MLLFILESFGSTELLFILVMALVFFGPRKLPQLSRSLGKSMAEFRRASEDFKRTWEKEVALETPSSDSSTDTTTGSREDNLLSDQSGSTSISTEYTVARERKTFAGEQETPSSSSLSSVGPNSSDVAPPSQKRDWL